MIAVPAEAHPRRSTRAPHARVPTLTPEPDRPAAQDDGPYGLEVRGSRPVWRPTAASVSSRQPTDRWSRGGRRRSAPGHLPTEEDAMILATTKVEDFDRFWSIFSTKGAEKRKAHGSKGAEVYRD